MVATLPGLKVYSTKDLKSLGVNMTLYGPGGSGKTTLPSCLHDTEFGPLLYALAGSGLQVVQHLDIPYVNIESWQDAEALLAAFKSPNPPEYKSIVLDNLSEYSPLLENSLSRGGIAQNSDSLKLWNLYHRKFTQYIRDWRDLTEVRDLNVFLIAWDQEDRDESRGGYTKSNIMFAGNQVRKSYPGLVDTIGHISTPDRMPDWRLISFEPGPRTISKFRRAPTANAMKVPFNIMYQVDNLPMADILRTIKLDAEWPASKYAPPSNERR